MSQLRRFRRAYGYQQKVFAEKVHIGPSYLCRLEKGTAKPSAALARIIADAFGAKLEAVFPDGVAEKDCRRKFRPAPPTPPESVLVPLPLPPRCPKCGASVVACDCYACGMELERFREARA